ncbi:MAG TPA: cyclic nucleotide-binding domain-containing protein [Thermoleophilaceae bacterium]|nr:cyclic nucleotide-binding domain-containing protein [Thermoleophilaceae bacterium]
MKLFSQDAKVKALKRAPLFDGLSRKELAQLARVSEDLEVEPGTVLCKEGDIGQEFFVIVDGKIKVTRKGRRVAARGAPDFVGEIALLEELPRTATVTAETSVRLFVLTGKDFRHLLDENPSVERKVLRALARRLAEASRDPALA